MDYRKIALEQMKYKDRVSFKMKEKRIELGLSQQYVAEQIGTTQPHYNRFESGRYNTTVKTLIKIAKVLNVNPEYFFNTK